MTIPGYNIQRTSRRGGNLAGLATALGGVYLLNVYGRTETRVWIPLRLHHP